MSALLDLSGMRDDLVALRHHIHAHPETAFDEKRTSDLVASNPSAFGLDVYRGLGGTGVVGTLKVGTSDKAIGLRADMDALFIHEANDFAHRSTNDGKMHACGHDGHNLGVEIGGHALGKVAFRFAGLAFPIIMSLVGVQEAGQRQAERRMHQRQS
jgi:metal-dependent amidase/aminoacylase/carboxypeptidase family protein